MSSKELAAELSSIERQALQALGNLGTGSVDAVSDKGRLNIDSARRALAWLVEKGLVEMSEEKKNNAVLTSEGRNVLERGLPELRMLKVLEGLKGRGWLEEIGREAGLEGKELNVALGIAKKNAWVTIFKEKGIELELTGLEKDALKGGYAQQEVLSKVGEVGFEGLDKDEKKALGELTSRGLVENVEVVERGFTINKLGKEVLAQVPKVSGERSYNVRGKVPEIFIGKRQPYIQFLSTMRKKLLSMGFQEMETNLVELEFYNFDVLFQPQNHPARSWSDTYALKNPTKGKIDNRSALKKVKEAHETGGVTDSKGWGYKWLEGVAASLMPCAHGTAASARQLVKGVKEPGKYFAIARCYRPDVPDATHLSEFNQMEGFIVDESFNFTHLLGMLKQFAIEIAGAEDVRFYPDYYPFTEPSVQLSAKHPQLGWVEFGGAGIFRPEITQQLGIKGKCLAWGLGIDRLAMFRLGINDIRELFSQNIDWLRKEKLVW